VLDWLAALSLGFLLVGAVIALLLITSNLDRRDPPDWSLYLSLGTLLAWVPIWYAATCLCWFLRGATIGMLSTGLCVVSLDGNLPGIRRSALRALALAALTGPAATAPLLASAALSLGTVGPIFIAGPLICLVLLSMAACGSVGLRPDRRGWHDLISGTQLIRTPKREATW